ncbi:DUF72 domain-containing protein [Pseudomonas sp. MDT1-16]
MAAIHIGFSGWRYTPWRGDFYPKGLTHKRELQFASRAVNSIEINGSFYALQRPERYAQWYTETPAGFVFSVNAPRFITHIRRLRDIHKPLANFFASRVLEFKEKLGPILRQSPPSFKFDAELFETFLEQLPHHTEEAAALAHQHDSRLNGRASMKAYGEKPLRHAVEIRNESFVDPAFVRLLKCRNAALVIADTAGQWPKARKSRAVFCYFDNDIKVRAPFDARRLLERFHLDKDLATRPGELAAEGVLS